jgi:glycosyltransferase involved in cell wall biosynthesis
MVIRKNENDQGIAKPKNRDAAFRHYLEAQLTQHSNLVWWFTDGALRHAAVRNPNLNTPGNAHGFMVLPGAEPPGGLSAGQRHVYTEYLNVCHFGSLAKDRSLSTILKAFIPLFQKYPEARNHLRLHAYGAPLDSLTLDALNKWGFEDVFIAHGRLEKDPITGKLGRERVVEKMQGADVLLLMLGHEEWCTEYIPSKFYEYLWAGRPIWGISHRNPQLDHMLLERGSYICYDDSDEKVAGMLETIWLDWRKQQLTQPIWKPIGVDQAVASILNHVQRNAVN